MPQLPMWRCASQDARCCLHYCGLSSSEQVVFSYSSPFIFIITAEGSSCPLLLRKGVHKSLDEDSSPAQQVALVHAMRVPRACSAPAQPEEMPVTSPG